MGFYEFTEPALVQFQRLEPWLAEETLDELEMLTAKPPIPRLKSPTGYVLDFVRTGEQGTFYVFLTIAPNRNSERLRVTSIGMYVRR